MMKLYFNEETRQFTSYEQFKQFKPAYEAYKNAGGKDSFTKWAKDTAHQVDNATPMKHGLTRSEVKELPKSVRDAVAKSIKDSRNKKGYVKASGSPNLGVRLGTHYRNHKTGYAVGAAVAGTAALGAGAYAIGKAVQKKKEKKAAQKAE